MPAILEVESTLADRYGAGNWASSPSPRQARQDHYTIHPSGGVVWTRAEPSEGDDPVLGQFLGSWLGTLQVILRASGSGCRPLLNGSSRW